jgi:hypothetical protein
MSSQKVTKIIRMARGVISRGGKMSYRESEGLLKKYKGILHTPHAVY